MGGQLDDASSIGLHSSPSFSRCNAIITDDSATLNNIVISNFLACYASILLLWRLATTGISAATGSSVYRRAVLYEYTWLCNSTLVMAAIAIRTCRPVLATSFCVAVSIDQLLWWVDLLGWLLSGLTTFPIGVMKYLTWPHTSWITRITSSHHLWTIPVTLHAARGMHWASYPLSVYVVTSHVLLSRWLTPFIVINASDKVEGEKKKASNIKDMQEETIPLPDKYLNVNLSHEVWKDIKFGFCQIQRDNPPTGVYLFRLLLRWNTFNLGTFVLLYVASLKFL